MIMMSSRITPDKKPDEPTSPITPAASEKKYFSAWKMKTGTKAINEKLGLLEGEDSKDDSGDVEAAPGPATPVAEEKSESKVKSVLTCIGLLGGGVAMVTIFSDPMCDVLTALTNKNNKSFLPIPPFYVSFVVTPFCSNASELVSSLIFAAKKTRENITMTYSQIFGAATMNNTLCMSIFMALVYFKDLEWIYGAEVVCIIVVQWVVRLVSLKGTFKMWMGIPVACTYVFCILIVYLLEFKAGWN